MLQFDCHKLQNKSIQMIRLCSIISLMKTESEEISKFLNLQCVTTVTRLAIWQETVLKETLTKNAFTAGRRDISNAIALSYWQKTYQIHIMVADEK